MSEDSNVLFIGYVAVALGFRKLIDTNTRITVHNHADTPSGIHETLNYARD